MEHIQFFLINATDGGSDHKNTYVQNQAVHLALFLLFYLLVKISTRNVADGSYINSIEQIMCIMNLGLHHVSCAQDECGDKDKENDLSF